MNRCHEKEKEERVPRCWKNFFSSSPIRITPRTFSTLHRHCSIVHTALFTPTKDRNVVMLQGKRNRSRRALHFHLVQLRSLPPYSTTYHLHNMTLHQNLSKLSLAPSYRTVDPNSTSTNGSSPCSQRVGKIDNVQFVTPSQLHRHLLLLGAFHSLRSKVEAVDFGGISDPRAKWTVFAHLASYRYELYVKEIVAAGSGTVTLPPLDVAMVFHTHLLNPTSVSHYFVECVLRSILISY